jgi:hypothetical protein
VHKKETTLGLTSMHPQKLLLAKRFLLSVSVVSGMGLLAILPNSALAQDMPEATPTTTTTTPLPTGTTPATTPSAIPEPTPEPEPISGEVEAETEVEAEAEGVLVEETEVIETEAVTEEPTEDELGVEADAVTTPAGGTAPATEIPAATPVSNPAATPVSNRALW